jgi:hypothetical protein
MKTIEGGDIERETCFESVLIVMERQDIVLF